MNGTKKTNVIDDDLDKVNGGIVIKPDDGFFTGTYMCDCGNKDFKVIGFYPNGQAEIECKKCGKHFGIDN